MEIVKKYLNDFSLVADDWFQEEASHLKETMEFFNHFKQREFIEKAEWSDFQELGKHINAFHTNALARANALGKPNHSIEHYRKEFINLIYGEAKISQRYDRFKKQVSFFGPSAISEIVGNIFPDEYIFFNGVDKKGAEILEIDPIYKRGATPGEQFVAFNTSIQPVIELYNAIVRKRTETSIPLEVDQFLRFVVIKTEEEEELEGIEEDKLHENLSDKPTMWLLAPGEDAYKWEEFYKNNFAALGWDDTGDLKKYTSREEIRLKLLDLYGSSTNKSHASLACYEFCFKIRIGDIVVAKRGTYEFIGWGIVTSDYYYNNDAPDYKHRRNVKWKSNKVLNAGDRQIVTKTLTNISKYPTYVDELVRDMGIAIPDLNKTNKEYWWLNANPKYWDILDFKVGEKQEYTSYNENGNKRRIYENFKNIQKGDIVIGYQTSPIKKITALFEVTKELYQHPTNGEIFEFVIKEFLVNPISWESLTKIPELQKCELFVNPNGSLFKLTQFEFEAIQDLIDQESETIKLNVKEDYTKDIARKESGLGQKTFDKYEQFLLRKKQIIFQGPPGTGKTYLANIFVKYLTGNNPDQYEMVQFHPSYSYEDFVEGFRPLPENNGIGLKQGIFKRICDRARIGYNTDSSKKYVILIDEINRGNLSKIFGELLFLLEYRDKKIKLTYSPDIDFSIPPNLFIIGTMNTADRSLAMVDYALRRRFSFIVLKPDYELLRNFMLKRLKDINPDVLIKNLTAINQKISATASLGSGFEIGHSYLLKDAQILKETLEIIWSTEIQTLLEEYYFDNINEVEQMKKLFFENI